MLISAGQQSDSVIHIYTSSFYILFWSGLSQDSEYNSLCFTVRPYLFILCLGDPKCLRAGVVRLVGVAGTQQVQDWCQPTSRLSHDPRSLAVVGPGGPSSILPMSWCVGPGPGPSGGQDY